MSKVRFEEDEMMILAIFECPTREETRDYIIEAEAFIEKEDVEILDLMKSAVQKLDVITDSVFKAFDLREYLFEEDAAYA